MNALRALAFALLSVLLSVAGVVPPAAAVRAASSIDPGRDAALRSTLADIRSNQNLPGISVAIRSADGSIWTDVVGRAEVGAAPRDVAAETAFSAGSITKTFVAALVMQQVERGTIHLNDRLSRWLPTWPNASRIHVDQLLSHRSGLFDYFESPRYESLVFGRPRHVWTPSEILRLVGRPVSAPGEKYDYSNTNYVLLARILRKATGQSVGKLIRTRLLHRLNLSHSAFQDVEPVALTSAKGYLRDHGTWQDWSDGTAFRPNTSAATVAWAAGAMLTTPSDLVRWGHALYADGSVVSADSLAQMTAFSTDNYGLGTEQFFTTDDPATQEPMWGHSGSLRGYEAQLWYVPSRNITIALMTNRGRVSMRPAVQNLLGVLLAP